MGKLMCACGFPQSEPQHHRHSIKDVSEIGVSKRVVNILYRNGINHAVELETVTRKQLQAMIGISDAAIQEIAKYTGRKDLLDNSFRISRKQIAEMIGIPVERLVITDKHPSEIRR